MGLVARPIGIPRATIKIDTPNLVYNFQRLLRLDNELHLHKIFTFSQGVPETAKLVPVVLLSAFCIGSDDFLY